MPLLAAYNFDEASGDVLDVTGNGHGFPLGALGVRTASGHTLSGLTRNTTPGLVTLADPAFGQTVHRTVMCWIRGAGTTWLVRWQADALGSGSWGLLHIGGNIAVQARTSDGSLLTRPTFAHPADGLWHHYAAVYDGTAARLYVDGVLRSSTSHAGGLYATADRIDIMEPTDTGTTIDDLRIFDEALDQPTIADLMDTPVGEAPSFSGTVTLSAAAGLSLAGARAAVAAASLTASAGATVAGVRESAGTALLTPTGGIVLSGATHRSGAVVLSATVSMRAQATADPAVTPPERTFVVPAESRVYVVPAESRTVEA